MSELQLEPHEQLDEIDLRTNDDGTVRVKLLDWEKKGNRVTVAFRVPTGEVEHESMRWPVSNSDEYKFIRLIDATPYTLRTAENIKEDDDLWLDARPDTWSLHLPMPKQWHERIPRPTNPPLFELSKVLLYPFVFLMLAFETFDFLTTTTNPTFGDKFRRSYFDNQHELERAWSAVKGTCITLAWVLLLILLL